MEILNKEQIVEIVKGLSHAKLMDCIEEAFIAYSNGTATVPPVGHLGFDKPPADVHIKYGYISGDPYYVVKIASGFYDNPQKGLPSSNGMMLAFDAQTGMPMYVLQDEGYLTDLRTAYAGVVAAAHLGPDEISCIGIVGTGIQARFQLRELVGVTECKKVVVWGRSEAKLQAYKEEMEAEGYEVQTTLDIATVGAKCNLIVTTTPSTTPLLTADHILPGTHITAMGADADGKQELDVALLGKASIVVADSMSQCASHGEIHHAIAANAIDPKRLIEMGDVIVNGFDRQPHDITIADLTGIATQDIKITSITLQNR